LFGGRGRSVAAFTKEATVARPNFIELPAHDLAKRAIAHDAKFNVSIVP
jgi:hypothetical protein